MNLEVKLEASELEERISYTPREFSHTLPLAASYDIENEDKCLLQAGEMLSKGSFLSNISSIPDAITQIHPETHDNRGYSRNRQEKELSSKQNVSVEMSRESSQIIVSNNLTVTSCQSLTEAIKQNGSTTFKRKLEIAVEDISEEENQALNSHVFDKSNEIPELNFSVNEDDSLSEGSKSVLNLTIEELTLSATDYFDTPHMSSALSCELGSLDLRSWVGIIPRDKRAAPFFDLFESM